MAASKSPSPDVRVQAVVSVGAIACLMRAYLTADAPIVSVFEYTLLIFASATAYILFGTVVSPLGLLGMVVIIGSGVIVAWRVQRAERLERNEQSELPEQLAQ